MLDQITVRLPVELSQALRRASRRLRRKNSDVVRMALEAFLGAGEPDRTDFSVYRLGGRKPFRILPEMADV